jgi:hypothetical protein
MLTTPAAEVSTPCNSSAAPRLDRVADGDQRLRRGESSTITEGKRSVRKVLSCSRASGRCRTSSFACWISVGMTISAASTTTSVSTMKIRIVASRAAQPHALQPVGHRVEEIGHRTADDEGQDHVAHRPQDDQKRHGRGMPQ